MEDKVYGYFFVSRNKDNKDVENFKQRKWCFLQSEEYLFTDECSDYFSFFVSQGVPGETCRLYRSVNSRNVKKTVKDLTLALVENNYSNNLNILKLRDKITSLAMRTENAAEKKWMFDVDTDERTLHDFLDDLSQYCTEDNGFFVYKTKNGFSVIIDFRFDTRELLKKYPDIELKRDGMIYITCSQKKLL